MAALDICSVPSGWYVTGKHYFSPLTSDCRLPVSLSAPVTRIIRGSTVDGPGLRTVVFFKGCSLRCSWCHNPETQSVDPELLFDERLCIGCRACAGACDFNAIDFSRNHIVDHETCTSCFSCCNVCPSGALSPAGVKYSVEALMKELCKDAIYYRTSKGGVTLSGGEPLLHPEFIRSLLRECTHHDIRTCIDTCLVVEPSALLSVIDHTDLFLVDIKHASRPEVQSETVFANLQHICGAARIYLRIPVIPQWNDTPGELAAIVKRCMPFRKAIEKVELLPFHNSATHKYRSLDRDWSPYEQMPPVSENRIEQYRTLFRKNGFSVT